MSNAELQTAIEFLSAELRRTVRNEDSYAPLMSHLRALLLEQQRRAAEPEAVRLVNDVAITPMPDRCLKCRIDFDDNGRPIYARLIERNGYFCCERCGGSYGAICEGCPPVDYPTQKTRCLPCPRRSATARGSQE
jgi:hypothetical protein